MGLPNPFSGPSKRHSVCCRSCLACGYGQAVDTSTRWGDKRDGFPTGIRAGLLELRPFVEMIALVSVGRPVSELRIVASLAMLYVFRMLGLFMVFPVMMIYGLEYQAATPMLLGLALGCYGLTQAIFQIPLGLLSDIWGRKPIIVAGLLVFAGGSLVAALSDSVWGLIIGRALQGAGAIASAVLALVGDLTSEQNRTRAMAVIGISIGLSFSIAMVLGPVLAASGGLPAIFWLSTGLALVGIAILWGLVPDPPPNGSVRGEQRPVFRLLGAAMRNADLQRLNLGIFVLHFVLTATFVAVPLAFEQAGIAADRHWHFYLPVMLLSFLAMVPFIYLAERKRRMKGVFVGAVAVLMVAELVLGLSASLWHRVIGLFIFFGAFNLLEATLPSLVSKQAPAGSKGTAMGVYSTCQFLGAAIGGIAGGISYSYFGIGGVFWIGLVVCAVWLLVALSMKTPPHVTSIVLTQAHDVDVDVMRTAVSGIVDAHWAREQALLYLKVDSEHFRRDSLEDYLDSVRR